MLATCSCHARLCRRHRQKGSSNRKARSTLQSQWALLLTHTWIKISPRATVPGYRRSRRPCSPASRNGTGRLPFANRAECKARPNLIWTRSSWSRLGQLDVANLRRSQIKSFSLAAGRRAASPRRGRVAGPDALGGKARHGHALVVRGAWTDGPPLAWGGPLFLRVEIV
jgi:hypothetical protein